MYRVDIHHNHDITSIYVAGRYTTKPQMYCNNNPTSTLTGKQTKKASQMKTMYIRI